MFATFKIVMVYTALGFPAALLGIPYSFLIGDIGPLYRLAMKIIRAGLRAGGIRVVVTGVENVPIDRTCIFMCNHVSNLDPPVVLPSLPGRSFGAVEAGVDADSAAWNGDAHGHVCSGGAQQQP